MIQVWSSGSVNKDRTRTNAVWTIKKDDKTLEEGSRAGGPGWSYTGEAYAIFLGLQKLLHLGLNDEPILWHCKSQFLIDQIFKNGEKQNARWSTKVGRMLQKFDHIEFRWLPREQNEEADALTKFGSKRRKK